MSDLVYPREKTLGKLTLVLGIIGWLLLIVGTVGLALIYVLAGFIAYCFAQSAWVAYIRGTAIRITADQFPDLHQRMDYCSQKLGIDPMPEAYILHGDGMFNAFATRFFGRNFVILFSDVVDALEHDPSAINFYIGHELGHIKLKHLTGHLWRMPVLWLPLLGAAYSRAREYSCDRHGHACCTDAESAGKALVALGAGAKRWATVDLKRYTDQVQTNIGFWPSFHELTAGYPYLTKRVARTLNPNASMPGRNPLAYVLAFFVPFGGRGGGGAAGLVVVVAAIGILASVALPAYQDYTSRAKTAEVILSLSGPRAALTERISSNPNAGLLTPQEITKIKSQAAASKHVESIDVYAVEQYADVVATANVGSVTGHVYTYTRDGGKTWNCGSTDFPDKYLPTSCRDSEGNDRPAPPEPQQTDNLGLWDLSYAKIRYNSCLNTRSKTDPDAAESFCKCLVYKLAEVVPQGEMERKPTSVETQQVIQTSTQACIAR